QPRQVSGQLLSARRIDKRFTGVIVIGAVLLDMYRTRKAAEVRIETPADLYRASMLEKIAAMRRDLSTVKGDDGNGQQAAALRARMAQARSELKANFAQMKAHERVEQARIRAEERAADHAFAKKELLRQEDTERGSTSRKHP
ncbi:MAG: hypothetical protein WCA89_17925, partial [Terracidiphilus sp.]